MALKEAKDGTQAASPACSGMGKYFLLKKDYSMPKKKIARSNLFEINYQIPVDS